jgi:hypothetical protein
MAGLATLDLQRSIGRSFKTARGWTGARSPSTGLALHPSVDIFATLRSHSWAYRPPWGSGLSAEQIASNCASRIFPCPVRRKTIQRKHDPMEGWDSPSRAGIEWDGRKELLAREVGGDLTDPHSARSRTIQMAVQKTKLLVHRSWPSAKSAPSGYKKQNGIPARKKHRPKTIDVLFAQYR